MSINHFFCLLLCAFLLSACFGTLSEQLREAALDKNHVDELKDDNPIPPHNDDSMAEIPQRTFDDFVGLCLLPDDPVKLAGVGNYLRPYILSKWFLYDVDEVDYKDLLENPQKLEFAFNPAAAGGGTWIEDGLKSYHNAGFDVVPSFKESFMFLTQNSKPGLDNKPRLLHEDGNDPWAWRWIGIYFYQFAARYGSTKVPEEKLLLRADQQKISGLGWVKYMQGENEADKWWLGSESEFSPEEWAAYHSVMYDGHMGRVGKKLGLGCGIKNADPEMKVVLGPLAHLNYDYFKRAITWWETNRTDDGYPTYPFDAFSMHRYANSAGKQRDLNGKGISPEDFDFYSFTKEFADFSHKYDKEAWITEFGYDVNPASPQGISPSTVYRNAEVQGMWLCRSYLEMYAAGMDRAAIYMLRDVADGPGIFQTCGITTGKGVWARKPAWYYIKTMTEALKGCNLVSMGKKNEYGVKVYEFKHGEKSAFAVWSPTSAARRIPNFPLNLPKGKYTIFALKDKKESGFQTTFEWQGGDFMLPVGEIPVFVRQVE